MSVFHIYIYIFFGVFLVSRLLHSNDIRIPIFLYPDLEKKRLIGVVWLTARADCGVAKWSTAYLTELGGSACQDSTGMLESTALLHACGV